MSHIGSFLWALSALSVGGRVVVARTTDSHELLPLLREHRPTVLAMIPAALMALVRDHDLQPDDFSSLRICRSGSDKVSTELLTEFAAAAGFPIVEGYGMTEVGLATLNPPSGREQAGLDRAADRRLQRSPCATTTATRSSAGAVGRICIRTRSRMAGYWKAPDGDRRGRRGRVARLRRPRPRRRGRLPLVLRPQEADHRPRRLQHQPVRGRGRAARAPGDRRSPASSASTTPSTARTSAPT